MQKHPLKIAKLRNILWLVKFPVKIKLLSWRRYSSVTDHGLVRGNGYDYANGIYNGYGHNNAYFPGQRISNGNDKGNDVMEVSESIKSGSLTLLEVKLSTGHKRKCSLI